MNNDLRPFQQISASRKRSESQTAIVMGVIIVAFIIIVALLAGSKDNSLPDDCVYAPDKGGNVQCQN